MKNTLKINVMFAINIIQKKNMLFHQTSFKYIENEYQQTVQEEMRANLKTILHKIDLSLTHKQVAVNINYGFQVILFRVADLSLQIISNNLALFNINAIIRL